MAVENCLQLSTSASVRAVALNTNRHLPPKCHLTSFHGLRRSFPTASSSVSCSLISSPSKSRISSIVCKASEAVNQVVDLNDSCWDERVLGSTIPVMVDFWAPWCGPCKLIAPTVDDLAKEFAGKIAVFKVNTDECPNIATKYNIRSIPTVLFFKNGERKDSIIGAVPKTTLVDTINKYIAD